MSLARNFTGETRRACHSFVAAETTGASGCCCRRRFYVSSHVSGRSSCHDQAHPPSLLGFQALCNPTPSSLSSPPPLSSLSRLRPGEQLATKPSSFVSLRPSLVALLVSSWTKCLLSLLASTSAGGMSCSLVGRAMDDNSPTSFYSSFVPKDGFCWTSATWRLGYL